MKAREDLFVVGIGASAGGIEALEGLFRHMPTDLDMAFVVALHLAPDKVSHLDEILQRFTPMPVETIVDGMAIHKGHVYVIPPGSQIDLRGGHLKVQHEPEAARRAFNPIDRLFASLAEATGDRAIAIVLSGAGSDGTLGIKAIKEAGGLALAQGRDHSRPRHESMPQSAIASGLVDLVLPVEEMGGRLAAYARTYTSTAPLTGEGGESAPIVDAANAKRQICAILRDQVGHDFSRYKEKTFLRRVQRRMQVVQLDKLVSYIKRLRQDPEEVTLLFRDLLIGVTNFFRDREAFDALEALVVPKLFEGKGADGTVRVWVPGCATGEEVYSIAILLRERMDGLPALPKVQIFGTDIDETALGAARAGRYPAGSLEDVSPQRLQRFFVEEAGIYTVSKELRDMCIFSAHSVVRDPPFSRIDLISCRNLLIYFNAELQAQVIPVFHYALRPGGYLFLGISENVSQHPDLFTPLDKKLRLFQRRDHVGSQVQFPLLLPGPRLLTMPGAGRGDQGIPGVPLRRLVETKVAEQFAPAHVVVNRDGNIVYYSLRTGKYLEQPPGTPNHQLLAMARKGLRLELRNAFQEAVETRRTVIRENIGVEVEDRVQLINLVIEPLHETEADPLFLVLFVDLGPPVTQQALAARRGTAGNDGPGIAQLEAELRDTRERLQSTIEEYETALEELKAANEELVSMNEELQSANEELETSKEEIQSINEELQTVNQELGSKVDQLNHANADLRNLFESTQIAVIFLDRDLVIRSFTPAVIGIFSLIPGDRGRPLTDIASHLDYGDLAADVRSVIETGKAIERRVASRGGAVHYQMRILPYRSGEATIDGALVTFVDITAPVQAEQQQRMLVQELNHRVRNTLAVVGVIASQTMAQAASPEAFLDAFLGRIDALGRSHGLLAREQWGDVGLRDILLGELVPQAGADRIDLEGPPVLLKPKAALAFGLIAHELATNALKHGALSAPEGRVRLTWSLSRQGDGVDSLVLRWREADGPVVGQPGGAGLGSVLIEREVRHDLGGELATEFQPDGLCVTITVPADPTVLAEKGDAARA